MVKRKIRLAFDNGAEGNRRRVRMPVAEAMMIEADGSGHAKSLRLKHRFLVDEKDDERDDDDDDGEAEDRQSKAKCNSSATATVNKRSSR